jgi:hypothetical protein
MVERGKTMLEFIKIKTELGRGVIKTWLI